jgi:hypothetical protein
MLLSKARRYRFTEYAIIAYLQTGKQRNTVAPSSSVREIDPNAKQKSLSVIIADLLVDKIVDTGEKEAACAVAAYHIREAGSTPVRHGRRQEHGADEILTFVYFCAIINHL